MNEHATPSIHEARTRWNEKSFYREARAPLMIDGRTFPPTHCADERIDMARRSCYPSKGNGRTSLLSVSASCSKCRASEKAACALAATPGAFVMNAPTTNVAAINTVTCFQCFESMVFRPQQIAPATFIPSWIAVFCMDRAQQTPGLVSSACEAVPKKVSRMSAGSHNASNPKLVVRFGRSLKYASDDSVRYCVKDVTRR